MYDKSLQPGEMGILQNLQRTALNGQVAEVTGALKRRFLYSLSNPADSEICPAYKVRVCGFPQVNSRIEWCVKTHLRTSGLRSAGLASDDHLSGVQLEPRTPREPDQGRAECHDRNHRQPPAHPSRVA